ncbi:MAG: nuclear transport factor 2 family protein [Candidatus Zixiibacteriota bacterium]|nr:MAG: nuclear transport factor 2 family protein [candidate division Zixibacteria bacterium]
MGNGDKTAVKQVIERAYIQGIHGSQDEETVKSGFHRDFAMLVLHNNVLEKVMVDEWLARVSVMKTENPDLWEAETRHAFDMVDVSGYAAVARLQVYKGAAHFSTDYMLLYKFEEGWKIVSKIFAIPS